MVGVYHLSNILYTCIFKTHFHWWNKTEHRKKEVEDKRCVPPPNHLKYAPKNIPQIKYNETARVVAHTTPLEPPFTK